MASNRGPNAVGSASNTVPAPSASDHQNSEYYKARNAQGGQAFSWAASGGGGAPGPAAAAPAAPSGVGGSWASAPAAPPPPPPSQMSVAAQARQPPAAAVSSAVPVTGNGYSSGGNSFGTGGAVSGGDYEKNLILELCPPGGMKAEPPPDKLAEFANAVPSLNPDLVCPALLDALEEGNPWIMRAKALCVIETVLKVEAERGGDVLPYTDFFHACSGEIEPLANHARASVKGPAKRVLTALGVDGASANGFANPAVSATSAPAPAAPPANLLDFDDEPAPPAAAPAAGSAPAAPAAAGDSLFSGLSTKSTVSAPTAAPPVAAPPAPAQEQDDLLGGMGLPPPAPAAAVDTGSNDLFGDMTVKSTESAPANGGTSEVSVFCALSYCCSVPALCRANWLVFVP